MASGSASGSRWLFGPAWDLLLGCGVLYALVFGVYAIGGAEARAHQPALLLPILIPLLALPHYGATLVRVYEQRSDRRQYALFAVYATLLLVAACVAGLQIPFAGSLLVTIYLTWSPWHYTGQNYGLAVMFLRRRQVELDARCKRVLYTSFVRSYVLVFISLHSSSGQGGVMYHAVEMGPEVTFLRLGIPSEFTDAAFAVVGAACVGCIVAAAVLLLRSASARTLLPVGMLVLTRALWFSLPFTVSYAGLATGIDPIDHCRGIQDYVFWVALGHSVQYLWVTTFYARASQGWTGCGRYLGKTLVAGVGV